MSNLLSSVKIFDPVLSKYRYMINDKWRNQFYFDALQKHAADKVVLDVGTGTGILAFYALRSGARYVYCVEADQQAAQRADAILADNFERSRFEVLNVNFWTDAIDNKINQLVDILVSETVGPGLFDQGMFHTWTCAQPFLAKNAISIPDRLHFDLWFWEKHRLPDIVDKCQQGNVFFPDATLDQNFAQSLISLDRKLCERNNFPWYALNDIAVDPYRIDKNCCVYSMDQLPPIVFSESDFPKHIMPQVEFTVELDDPSIMSIVNQISFEDKTLFLKDATWMRWRYAPTFMLQEPGEYQFRYNNFGLEYLTSDEWVFQHKFF